MRRRFRTAATVTALLGATFLAPTTAVAQGSGGPLTPGQGPGNPLTPFTPSPATPTVTTGAPVTTTSTGSGSLSGTDAVVIGIGAVLILGGISFYIWRDARRRAPVRQRAATAAAGGDPGARQRPQKARKLSPAERRRRKRGRAR